MTASKTEQNSSYKAEDIDIEEIKDKTLESDILSKSKENSDAIDDTKETVNAFLDKIALAKSQGQDTIETSQQIIDHYNRNGLNGAEFFIYQGIKVYPFGRQAEIEAEQKMTLEEKKFGARKNR